MAGTEVAAPASGPTGALERALGDVDGVTAATADHPVADGKAAAEACDVIVVGAGIATGAATAET